MCIRRQADRCFNLRGAALYAASPMLLILLISETLPQRTPFGFFIAILHRDLVQELETVDTILFQKMTHARLFS